MATTRRTPARRSTPRRRSSRPAARSGCPIVSPEVARSIVGIALLVARRGHADRARPAGPGRADRLVARLDRAVVRDRPLAAAVPAARRRLVRRVGTRQAPGSGWGATLARARRSPIVGLLGAFEVLDLTLFGTERGGGRIGRFLAGDARAAPHRARRVRRLPRDRRDRADARVQPPAQRAPPRRVTAPPAGSARPRRDSMRGAQAAAGEARGRRQRRAAPVAAADDRQRAGRAVAAGQPRRRAAGCAASILDEPAPRAARRRMSQTVWTGAAADRRARGRTVRAGRSGAALAGRAATGVGGAADRPRVAPGDRLDACRRSSCSSRAAGRVGGDRDRPRVEHRGGSRRSC